MELEERLSAEKNLEPLQQLFREKEDLEREWDQLCGQLEGSGDSISK